MEVPTLELRTLKGENVGPAAEDRSNSPYPTIPTPLPPYSDMDNDSVITECNGFSNNAIDIGSHSGGETLYGASQDMNKGTVPSISAFYAKIMVLGAAILIFLEVIPGSVPFLLFQGYVFTYLLCGSVVIFVIAYIVILQRVCPRFIYVEYNTNHEEVPLEQNIVYSNISIYLRLSVIVFGLVTLISDGLEIASLYSASSNCISDINFAEIFLREIFNLLQIHFLLINAKEIIHASGFLQYIALMHLLATNLSICIRLLIWESAKDWLDASHVKHNSSTVWPPKDFSVTYHSVESDVKSTDITKHYPTHKVYLTTNCYWRDPEEVENSEDLISLQLCLQNSTVGAVWKQAMPYLYAFKIEYSLIASVIIYLMWSNLQSSDMKGRRVVDFPVNVKTQNNPKVNCSNFCKGVFVFFIVIIPFICCLTLFFLHGENKSFDKIVPFVSYHSAILLLTAMVSVMGIRHIKKLKSQVNQKYKIIEVLKEVGRLAACCLGICSMVAGCVSLSQDHLIVFFVDGISIMVQACLQSLFIHQVSEKKLSPSNVDVKRGQQIVIFLIISNLFLWLFESLTLQNLQGILFYRQLFGDIAWPLILRITAPLVIFYRFHSTVLLAEAWRKLYKNA